MNKYSEDINNLFPQMVSWRRYLHQHPELSFQEIKTAGMVGRLLKEWGLEVKEQVGGHGITALLRGAYPGPTVGLRADMDALPIQDQKTCEYASTVPGVMHACGHDAHTAALLGLASHLSRHREILNGNVQFIFQHAEEVTPGGAASMIQAGALEHVDVIYGVHLFSTLPSGEIHTREGPIMAAADEFIIEIKGKGGHAGMPHEAVDSIVIASHLIVQLQSIVSRSVDPLDSLVISVGTIQGGNSFNVIAEKTLIKGTVRSFNEEVRASAKDKIEDVTKHICSMFGADYELEYRLGYPPVVNHAKEAERIFQVAASLFGKDAVKQTPQMMAGEDFAYYLQQIPGCFVFVGARNEKIGAHYSHHHPKFDVDETAMMRSAQLLLNLTLDYLASP
jgi:amidohydrolase